MSSQLIRVRAPSRLHFGLLSLGGRAERHFGGVGVMVDAPGLTLAVRRAQELSAAGPLAERALGLAREFAKNQLPREPACLIEIESAPLEHVGLGTGTQLALAVAAGLSAWAKAESAPLAGESIRCSSVSDVDAVRWAHQVGRGERSAIGTHGFARGGLLVEGGKRAAGSVSPLVSRLELPADWRFVLLVDPSQRGLSGAGERQAFAELPQVAPEATARLCREVLVEMLPAAAEGDFSAFSESVYRYGYGGAYAAGLPTELVAWLRGRGIRGVGQSSWGPTVFALARDADQAAALATDACRQFAAANLTAFVAAPANRGATIESA
jgi:beta-ribofuranosylaminobenzene 5'-phosphate synthase